MRKWFMLLLVLMMTCSAALADDGRGVLAPEAAPTLSASEAVVQIPEAVLQAVKAALPDAEAYYALEEYDDGRKEWEVFFTTAAAELGCCSVKDGSYQVRDVERYANLPAGALLVTEALTQLQTEKGAFTPVELEMERENGHICYEGQGLLDGRMYEFVITVEGKVLEWERD